MMDTSPNSIKQKAILWDNLLLKKRECEKERYQRHVQQRLLPDKINNFRRSFSSPTLNHHNGFLSNFVMKLTKTMAKSNKSNLKRWKKQLQKHLAVFARPLFKVAKGTTGQSLHGREITKCRNYIISFFSVNKKMTDGGSWIDLFEVKKSKLPGANMGLFALQSFKAGDMLGVYYGKILPPESSDYSCYAMKSDMHKIIVDCGGGIDSNHPVYFGLQFANDPVLCKTIKTRSDDRLYAHNIFVDENFIARASDDIIEGQELFLYYGWNTEEIDNHNASDPISPSQQRLQTDDSCRCSGCSNRIKNFSVAPADI